MNDFEGWTLQELIEHGIAKGNFEEMVPVIIRACRRDDCVDATETLIQQFEDIEWNWYPNG